jgi:hypothetical protein
LIDSTVSNEFLAFITAKVISLFQNNTLSIYSLYLNMGTSEIITEINKLPVSQRLTLIELTIKKIREEEKKNRLKFAAEKLYDDYATDPELTAFSSLDHEDFYEAK